MQKTVLVVDANPDERRELCRILERNHYFAAPMADTPELTNHLKENRCDAILLDLDSLPVENRFIRNLSRENPELRVIGISSRTFHPELEEAMRAHIYACLSKPVDEDELVYWLKSICGGELRSMAAP
jgi:DNA-binding NtrC family response regulator